MRAHGQAKLGLYPLPLAEADRSKNWLYFSEQSSALDPCVGDGIAFAHLLREAPVRRYGIESSGSGHKAGGHIECGNRTL
jgi:hypothetical protein